jgi:hypothetical protein
MPVRWLPLFALLLSSISLVTQPAPSVRAEQQASGGPALILRLRPIDSLQADVKYLLKQAGQGDKADQVDELLKVYVKDSGVDTKRPLGGYGWINNLMTEPTFVFVVPITNQKAFVKKLDGFGYVPKEESGVYTLAAPVGKPDMYLRFANDYAYVANEKAAVKDATKLLAPGLVFDPADKAALSAIVRFGQIPKTVRDDIIDNAMNVLELFKQAKDETDAQAKFKAALLTSFGDSLKQVLNEGNELALRLDVDQKGGEITADFSLSGQPTSKLAKSIADLGNSKSLFAGALGSDAAMSLLINASMSDSLKKAAGPVIDEGIEKALREEKKEENKVLAEKFLKVLTPTLKSGELDTAITMRGPSKNDKYSMVFGIKIKDGAAVDKTFRDIAKGLKKEEQERIFFDAEKIGTINVHKLDVAKDVDKKAKEMFGDGPLYLAIRSDAAYFAFGDGALVSLKEALSAKPGIAPVVQLEISISRFSKVMAIEDPDIAKAAKEAFGSGKANDRLRVTLEGGKSLRTRFVMKSDVLRFFAEVAKLKGAGAGE